MYLYVSVFMCGWGQSVFSLVKDRTEAFGPGTILCLQLFTDTHFLGFAV